MKSFNEITPEHWRARSASDRSEVYLYWNKRGKASLGCLRCGFPTGEWVRSCVACEHHSEITYSARVVSHEFREALAAWYGRR